MKTNLRWSRILSTSTPTLLLSPGKRFVPSVVGK
jgi:hypothetical protein